MNGHREGRPLCEIGSFDRAGFGGYYLTLFGSKLARYPFMYPKYPTFPRRNRRGCHLLGVYGSP